MSTTVTETSNFGNMSVQVSSGSESQALCSQVWLRSHCCSNTQSRREGNTPSLCPQASSAVWDRLGVYRGMKNRSPSQKSFGEFSILAFSASEDSTHIRLGAADGLVGPMPDSLFCSQSFQRCPSLKHSTCNNTSPTSLNLSTLSCSKLG